MFFHKYLFNSCKKNKTTPKFKNTSARLKTGKSPILIKSLTHHRKILSSKFPTAQAKNNTNTNKLKYFFFHIKIKTAIETIATTTINTKGNFIHQDIQMLNTF